MAETLDTLSSSSPRKRVFLRLLTLLSGAGASLGLLLSGTAQAAAPQIGSLNDYYNTSSISVPWSHSGTTLACHQIVAEGEEGSTVAADAVSSPTVLSGLGDGRYTIFGQSREDGADDDADGCPDGPVVKSAGQLVIVDLTKPTVTASSIDAPTADGKPLLRGGGSYAFHWTATDSPSPGASGLGPRPIILRLHEKNRAQVDRYWWLVPGEARYPSRGYLIGNTGAAELIFPENLNTVPDTSYHVDVFVIDNAQNILSYTGPDLIFDSQAPPTPTLASVAGAVSGPIVGQDDSPQIEIQGLTAGDTVLLFSGDQLLASATANSPVVFNAGSEPDFILPAEGEYVFYAKARDIAGNESGPSPIFSYLFDGTPPSVTLLSPVGGETWVQGSVQPIQWTASDNIDGSPAVALDYSFDGTNWSNLGSGLPASGTLDWSVPVGAGSAVFIRAGAGDLAGHTSYEVSGPISLVAPTPAPSPPAGPPPPVPPPPTPPVKASSVTTTTTLVKEPSPQTTATAGTVSSPAGTTTGAQNGNVDPGTAPQGNGGTAGGTGSPGPGAAGSSANGGSLLRPALFIPLVSDLRALAPVILSANPKSRTVRICFTLSATSKTTLQVLSYKGVVAGLFANRLLKAGRHCVPWNGTAAKGKALPPGNYALKLSAAKNGKPVIARGMVLLAERPILGAQALIKNLKVLNNGFRRSDSNPDKRRGAIAFGIDRPSYVTIRFFNRKGVPVRTLLAGMRLTPGTYNAWWRALDSKGKLVPAGLYRWELVVSNGWRNTLKNGTILIR